MYVEKYMLEKSKLNTVDLEDSLESALKEIEAGNFLSLPVLSGNEFKGYLMKETIYRKFFDYEGDSKEEYLKDIKVKDIYTDEYKSIQEDELVEEASYLLKEFRTPFLPVFNGNNEFVGILTHTAIFNVFSQILGLGRGSRLVINFFDIPGQLAKLTEVIKKEKVNIVNFSALDTGVMNIYKVILRADTKSEKELDDLIEAIEEAGFRIEDINE